MSSKHPEAPNSYSNPIQWYPGHIAKLRNQLDATLKLVDIIVIVLDARMPMASFNQEVLGPLLKGNKPALLVLNKQDLANTDTTKDWLSHFEDDFDACMGYSSKSKASRAHLVKTLKRLGETTWRKLEAKGLRRRPLRIAVAGMPNVGKSSLINTLIGNNKVKTGDKAGVTRSTRWCRIDETLEVLDTPGLIPPRLDDQDAALLLAAVYSIGEQAFDAVEVANTILNVLSPTDQKQVKSHYKLSEQSPLDLENVAQARSMKLDETTPDLNRAAHAVLKELRHGDWGGISFERPNP